MQSKNMICQDCGTELQTENYIFWEICRKCGKILCLNCVSINSDLQYSCKECLANNNRQDKIRQYSASKAV